jgi:hypothetical protein
MPAPRDDLLAGAGTVGVGGLTGLTCIVAHARA